jgi:predicted AAA+ superfamily ATPase
VYISSYNSDIHKFWIFLFINRVLAKELENAFSVYPVVTLIGPRQSGKSTLVKALFPKLPYVNLESPNQMAIAKADPVAFIKQYQEGAIIDEVQNFPELLSYIQVHVDEKKKNGLFVLTGSHQLALHQAIAQSLAGRTAVLQLLPLSLAELLVHQTKQPIAGVDIDSLLIKGFYPRTYECAVEPYRFYEDYVSTYLERDVRKLTNLKDIILFQNFMVLCASRIGQVINQQSMANDLGVSSTTISQWLSVLEASFVIVRLKPYFENLGKRIIKSPKLYFVDVGLASHLNGIESLAEIQKSPLKGALVENLVVIELFKHRYNLGKSPNLYFYRDSHQNEVDLIYKHADQLTPIEIKNGQTFNPRFLKGLHYFRALAPNRVKNGYLLYKGDVQQQVQGFYLLNMMNLDSVLTADK